MTLARRDRMGVALMIVLICLIVVATIFGSTLRYTLLNHRHVKQCRNKAQAVWLAESAIERAVFLLGQNREYRGETWQLPTEALRGQHTGDVRIKVALSSNREWIVEVVATFPSDSVVHHVKVRKQVVVERSPEE